MLILQIETLPFWRCENPDIYSLLIGIAGTVLSLIGFCYSKKASEQAELAKNAAKEAGIVVKRQGDLMELQRILTECSFSADVTYFQVNNILNTVSARTHEIMGVFNEDKQMEDTIKSIKNSFDNIRKALNDANPSLPLNTVNNKKIDEKLKINYVYNITSQPFAELMDNLGTLKGILNSKIIKN